MWVVPWRGYLIRSIKKRDRADFACRGSRQQDLHGTRKKQERDYHTWIVYSRAADIVGRSNKTK